MGKTIIPPEIQTLSSRLVYENRWLSLREDRILRPSGYEGIYSVVEKRDFAVIAAIQDGMIRLVEQYRYPVAGRYWELPQGSWDKDNADPCALAAAELREETGLIAERMQHVGRLFLAYGLSNQAYDIFLASGLSHAQTDLEPEEEGLISRAFPLSVVEQMIMDGTIVDASTVAAWGLLKMKGLLPSD